MVDQFVQIGNDYYPSSGLFDDGALRPDAAAEFAGVSRSTAYRLMESGEWPYSMGTGGRKVPRRALVIWLEQGMRARKEPA